MISFDNFIKQGDEEKYNMQHDLLEIERLNNIISELENELYKFYAYEGYNDEQIKDKIKELKGSDKE